MWNDDLLRYHPKKYVRDAVFVSMEWVCHFGDQGVVR